MRRERERDLVPTHVNVGMMLRLLGEGGDGVGEIHRGGKIFELKRPRNHVAVFFQSGKAPSARTTRAASDFWTGGVADFSMDFKLTFAASRNRLKLVIADQSHDTTNKIAPHTPIHPTGCGFTSPLIWP